MPTAAAAAAAVQLGVQWCECSGGLVASYDVASSTAAVARARTGGTNSYDSTAAGAKQQELR